MSSIEVFDVREMTEGDIDFALNLTNLEEWAYTRPEFERMFRFAHAGSFVWEEKMPLGFVSSIQYGGTAVVSHLVVSSDARGKNVGKRLMQACLRELDEKSFKTTLLFSTASGEPLYRSLGFRVLRDVTSCAFRVDVPHVERVCPPISEVDMPEVCALDERAFGGDRSELLNRLFEEHPDMCFKAVHGDRITGYVFARRSPLGGDIGPWSSCGSDEDARALFLSAISCFVGGRVDMGFFSDEPIAVELVSSFPREKHFAVRMMVNGDARYPRGDTRALGIAGFELG